MNKSDAINELAAALAKAQGEIKGAAKDATNPHFKSSYADLESVWSACRAALTKNGLSVVQGLEGEGESFGVETMLMHSSGQWVSTRLAMKPQQITPQALGSLSTYLKRYQLQGIAGVAPTDDDDGEAAEARGSSAAPKPAAKTAAPTSTAGDPLRAAYKSIMDGIAKAANPEGLQALMKARAADIQAIKDTSEEGYTKIMAAATKRTTELSQAPIPEKEAA